jgi:CspA family cold shock protein
MTEEEMTTETTSSRLPEMNIGTEVGNVVWFDQKKGFGFVRILTPESEYLGKEIFVHFSSINSQNNFKKLYPGENVSLDVERNSEGDTSGKEFSSKNVSGLYGSLLLVDNPTYLLKVIRRRSDEERGEQ